jgi:hypothetical protein
MDEEAGTNPEKALPERASRVGEERERGKRGYGSSTPGR